MSRKRQNRDHNEQQTMLVQMSCFTGSLDIRTDKQNPRNIWTINIFMHLTTESHVSWGFPTNPPPRPRPFLSSACTAAFDSRRSSTTESWPDWAAKCSGVLPQEPRPEAKPQAEPNRTNWEKLWDNFDASRVKALKIVATQFPPWT